MRFARPVTLAILAAAILAPVSTQADSSFTIEDVMSAPFTQGLVGARHADRFAWVTIERGARSIWTAAAPDFAPVRIAHYPDDDGQALGSLMLSDDGARLLYVRGGGPNNAGEIPNPTSNPAGAKREIYLVATSGDGQAKLITEGSGPSFSPDGKSVMFSKGGLKTISLDKENAEAKPLFAARGGTSNTVWSPDGTALAFVSLRGTHAFVGVYRSDTETITWMAPDVDRDVVPAWSPDGTRLAFVRLPGFKKDERFYLMVADPMELMVADARTGAATSIFSADKAHGFFALGFGLPLVWSDNDNIVFQSEHEGHLRFYKIAASGGEAQRLTDGVCETESANATADASVILVSNNCTDVSRRDIWRIDTASGALTQLTSGNNIEVDPTPGGGNSGVIAFRSMNVTMPAAVHIMAADGSGEQHIFPPALPGNFPADQLVTPENIELVAEDGITSYGQIFMPPESYGDNRPAVIFMHGGPIRQMWPAWHSRGYYANAYALNQYLASRGYVVMALNYRAGIGYGRDFRAVADHGPRGSSEYKDVVAAGRYLRRMDNVDKRRIGLWGGSYGGTLTGMGLSRDPKLFRTGVAYHGVFDWSMRSYRLRGREGAGGWAIVGDEAHALAIESSTVGDLSKWKAPVLLISGDDDRNVVIDQTVDLAHQLRDRGVHVETLIFPDEVHGFLRHENWLKAYGATANFLDRFLAGDGE